MYTFYIKNPFISEDILLRRGNWKRFDKKKNTKKINFVIIEKSISRDFLKNKSYIENYSDIVSGKNKLNFVNNFLNSKHKKLVPNQTTFDNTTLKEASKFIKKDKIYIVKPELGYKGIGIEVIENKEYFLSKKYGKGRWVLQEYITNPLLYNSKKFHLRCYYILTSDGETFLADIFKIITAKKKYKNSDFLNKDIHDTHYLGKKSELWMKKDDKYLDYNKIRKLLIKAHKAIIKSLEIKCYENSDFCYNIFGSDVIITDDYKVKILELNKTPGMNNNVKIANFSTSNFLLEGVMQEIVDKKFPPAINQSKNNNLIKLN